MIRHALALVFVYSRLNWIKPRQETHCFHAPVLPHLTLEMLRNRFGEGVAGRCLPTLMHA